MMFKKILTLSLLFLGSAGSITAGFEPTNIFLGKGSTPVTRAAFAGIGLACQAWNTFTTSRLSTIRSSHYCQPFGAANQPVIDVTATKNMRLLTQPMKSTPFPKVKKETLVQPLSPLVVESNCLEQWNNPATKIIHLLGDICVEVIEADGNANMWNISTREKELENYYVGTPNIVTADCLDHYIITKERANTIKVTDTQKEMVHHLCHISPVTTHALNAEKQICASGSSNGIVKLWDLKTGDCIKTLASHTTSVDDLAWTPDNTTLISVSSDAVYTHICHYTL